MERFFENIYPANNLLFNFNNRKTGKRSKICSNLTINTRRQRHWHYSGIFIVSFEHILHLLPVFLLLTLIRWFRTGWRLKRNYFWVCNSPFSKNLKCLLIFLPSVSDETILIYIVRDHPFRHYLAQNLHFHKWPLPKK